MELDQQPSTLMIHKVEALHYTVFALPQDLRGLHRINADFGRGREVYPRSKVLRFTALEYSYEIER